MKYTLKQKIKIFLQTRWYVSYPLDSNSSKYKDVKIVNSVNSIDNLLELNFYK